MVASPTRLGPDSQCRKSAARNANDNGARKDSNHAMTTHRSAPFDSTAANAPPPLGAVLMRPLHEFFTAPTFDRLLTLLVGVVLATGQRTVAPALRVLGVSAAKDFARS